MTSQISLNKLMKEDFKHRIWMLILSLAVQIIAGPIYILLSLSNAVVSSNYAYAKEKGTQFVYLSGVITRSFSASYGIIGAFIAIVGAIIVSVVGFRHLYSKKMMDMYGSIPVTRTRQFFSIYLNGLLMWAVPFFISIGASLLICELALSGSGFEYALFTSFLYKIMICVLSFLSAYHLCLLCTVFSGHAFVATFTSIVLGVDAVLIWESVYALESNFLNCFFTPTITEKMIAWLSPFSTGFVLASIVPKEAPATYTVFLVGTIVLIALNLFLSLYFYKKRESELAEGGMSNKGFIYTFRIVNCVLLGLLGYNFMTFFVGTDIPAWSFFGLAVLGVAGYGLINIILYRSGKAFFKNKAFLFVSLGIALFITSSLTFDLFGIDSYVPSKNNIKEASVYFTEYSDDGIHYSFEDGKLVSHYSSDKTNLGRYIFTDQELIYNLLSTGANNSKRRTLYGSQNVFSSLFFGTDEEYIDDYTSAQVSVTLKNGFTYTRNYRFLNSDSEVIQSVILDEGYQKAYYPILTGTFPYPDEIYVWAYYDNERSIDFYISEADDIKEVMDTLYSDFDSHSGEPINYNNYSEVHLQLMYEGKDMDDYTYEYTWTDHIYINVPGNYINTCDIIDQKFATSGVISTYEEYAY